jgi:ABC-type uncharacterized transport system permease subunit
MSSPAELGLWGVPIAVVGGAMRAGTPFLYVSLGECITEKSGRVNLGLEGTLVMGALAGFAVSYWCAAPQSGSATVEVLAPWLGILASALVGGILGALHALFCNLKRVNNVAMGLALMVFGLGLAADLGKWYVPRSAPRLPAISFGWWSDIEPVRNAFNVNVLFLIGVVLARFWPGSFCTRVGD